MPQGRNEQEVRAMLKEPLQEACMYVAQKLWNTNKELIRQVVYEAYTPLEYQRTMAFQDAWETREGGGKGDASAEFYDVLDEMPTGSTDRDADNFGQHIGVAEPYLGQPVIHWLADIIYQGKAGTAFGYGPWRQKRDAWTALMRKADKQQIEQWFKKGCKIAGLQVNQNSHITKTVTNT